MVQMPALHPQFGWCKSRLPRKAQPVPPIFQPEVAARAIYYAAHHPLRREYYPAWSSVKAIFGNKLAPSFADHYLARMGSTPSNTTDTTIRIAQQSLRAGRRGSGAHGAFDSRASYTSKELWAETHWQWLAAAVGVALGGAALALFGGSKATAEKSQEDAEDWRQREPREQG